MRLRDLVYNQRFVFLDKPEVVYTYKGNGWYWLYSPTALVYEWANKPVRLADQPALQAA